MRAELHWGAYPQTYVAYICPVCGWTVLEEDGAPGQECEAYRDSSAEPHGRCSVVGLVPVGALQRAIELLDADSFDRREIDPMRGTLIAARAGEDMADA